MKRIVSLLLAGVIMVSAVPVTYAADTQDHSLGTQVTYTAANNESYFITVPAKLNPGQSGTVTLDGMWPSDKTISVTAESTVTLTNSILASDQKVLDVTFLGIEKAGNDTAAQTFTETVSVEGIENALFGTWSGKFNYNVETSDATNQVNTPLQFGERYVVTEDDNTSNLLGTWVIFYEDGSAKSHFCAGNGEQIVPAETFIYSNTEITTVDVSVPLSISADGTTLTCVEDGATIVYTLESAIQEPFIVDWHIVNNGQYKAEYGMTWKEWANSEYYNEAITVTNDRVLVMNDDFGNLEVVYENFSQLKPTDKIIPCYNYYPEPI